MALYKDGKITFVENDKEVETIDWNNDEERNKALRYLDQGRWKFNHDDQITSWKKDADEYNKNKDLINQTLGFAKRLQNIKEGKEDPDVFIKELESKGIKLTKKEKEEFDDDNLDPVSRKLLEEIHGLKWKIEKFEQSSTQAESIQFDIQMKTAHSNLLKKYDGKIGPKYDPKEIEDYYDKNGENSIYHPDVEKQNELVYWELHREDILKAERKLSGMSEAEREKLRADAQGLKGGGDGVESKPFTPVKGDTNLDAALKAVMDDMKASGRSLVTDD